MKKELTAFAKNLKIARERKGFTQKELAELVGVSEQTISAYQKAEVNGKGKNPTLENVIAIAKVLDVSLDELCGLNVGTTTTLTTGNAARIIVKLLNSDQSIVYTEVEETRSMLPDPWSDYEPESYVVSVPAIKFKEGDLSKFVADYQKMRKLHIGRTIDSSFFQRWLEDRTAALDNKPLCVRDIFAEPPRIEDEDELPF